VQFEQVFTSVIEVGIATAGFSGIVVVLGQRAQGEWSQSDLGRISLLLQTSFAAIFLAFLPLVLGGAGVSEAAVWRACSGTFAVYVLMAVPPRVRQIRRLQAEDPNYSPALFWAVMPMVGGIAALQLYNAVFLQLGWPFVVAVLYELAMAFVMFVRLLQQLWK
jgi:hypothetical protein